MNNSILIKFATSIKFCHKNLRHAIYLNGSPGQYLFHVWHRGNSGEKTENWLRQPVLVTEEGELDCSNPVRIILLPKRNSRNEAVRNERVLEGK